MVTFPVRRVEMRRLFIFQEKRIMLGINVIVCYFLNVWNNSSGESLNYSCFLLQAEELTDKYICLLISRHSCNISYFKLLKLVGNLMAHAQKPHFVFRLNGRVHLNRRGSQFSRLLAAEVCASAVVMLVTPRSEVVWRVLATHSIRQFPLHFPSRASPCANRFRTQYTRTLRLSTANMEEHRSTFQSISRPHLFCSDKHHCLIGKNVKKLHEI